MIWEKKRRSFFIRSFYLPQWNSCYGHIKITIQINWDGNMLQWTRRQSLVDKNDIRTMSWRNSADVYDTEIDSVKDQSVKFLS
jgi:hypothetical protein